MAVDEVAGVEDYRSGDGHVQASRLDYCYT
jgi:hypothetical protein